MVGGRSRIHGQVTLRFQLGGAPARRPLHKSPGAVLKETGPIRVAMGGAEILVRLKAVADEDRLAGGGVQEGEQTTVSQVCSQLTD
jgi:hypothetical protein